MASPSALYGTKRRRWPLSDSPAGSPSNRGSHDGRTLAGYARKIRKWQKDGKDVYCYFDNDQKAYAPADACELRNKLNTVH